MILKGSLVKLRALEPEDIDALLEWENNPDFWHLSTTLAPFSRYALKQYIQLAQHDVYTAKQLRLMIVAAPDYRPVGTLDLYDFDPFHRRAGVGILIGREEDRRRGYATDGLFALIRYAWEVLQLHQLYAQIPAGNKASHELFSGCGFEHTGTRKAWNKRGEEYEDEFFYQLIRS